MKKTLTQSIITSLFGCALLATSFHTKAQVSITTLGVPYTETFDALANTGTTNAFTALPGWSLLETLANANQLYSAGTGSGTAGDTYSYGVTATTDRALGSIASGTLGSMYGANYMNNSGSPITNLAIGYIGEQWRCGATGRLDSLVFQYSLDATSLSTGTWINVPALNFKTPNTLGPVGALVGNLITNEAILSANITGLNITNGTGFWIRWTDVNITGADDGLAVDNFALTASFVNSLSITDVSVIEGNVGTTNFDFVVSLSSPADVGGVTFDISTFDFTALAPGDYVAQNLTAQTIPQGSTSYIFSVLVNGDLTVEPNDTFLVNVTNIVGATAAKSAGLGVILNDDFTPPVITLDPTNQTACNGLTATFTAAASGTTPTVQWQVSADAGLTWTNIPGAITSTLAFAATSLANGTMYQAIYTNAGGSATTLPATLTVNPSYAINTTASVCSGLSYTFADGTTTNNITAQVIHASMLLTALGCDSIITTTVNVNPTYAINTTVSVCSGLSYTFPDGTTTNNITAQVIHASMLFTALGCDSIITTTVNVNPLPDTSTTLVSFTITSNAVGATYQWLDCTAATNIPGAINQSYTAIANGSYAVDVTLNGCTARSACVAISGIGLKSANSNLLSELKIYPNPTQSIITIEFQSDLKSAKLTLMNTLGQIIISKEVVNSNKVQLNLQDVNAGIYYLQVEHNGEKTVKRITKE